MARISRYRVIYVVGFELEDHVAGHKVTYRELDFSEGPTLRRFLESLGLSHYDSATSACAEIVKKTGKQVVLVKLTDRLALAHSTIFMPNGERSAWQGVLPYVPDKITLNPRRRAIIEAKADLERLKKLIRPVTLPSLRAEMAKKALLPDNTPVLPSSLDGGEQKAVTSKISLGSLLLVTFLGLCLLGLCAIAGYAFFAM